VAVLISYRHVAARTPNVAVTDPQMVRCLPLELPKTGNWRVGNRPNRLVSFNSVFSPD